MSQRKKIKKLNSYKKPDNGKIKILIIGIVLGLSFSVVAVAIISLQNKTKLAGDKKSYHPMTWTIMDKFICGCSKCEMLLSDCDCPELGGGVFEKYYISQKLFEEYPESRIIQATYNKFGRIKNEYKHLVTDYM